MNYYRRYIGDFQADTMSLSMMEQGAYDRLLDHYYASEKPIPLNTDRAAIICRAVTMEERAAVQMVLDTYFQKREDGWHNARADKEIGLSMVRSKAGKQGADGKWHGKPDGKGDADAMAKRWQNGCPPTTNHQPPEKPKTKATPEASLPSWVPEEPWISFVEMRVKIRAPLTDKAKTLALAELSALRDQGHDPRAVLEQSVMRSWRGLFPPKIQSTSEPPKNWRDDPRFAGAQ